MALVSCEGPTDLSYLGDGPTGLCLPYRFFPSSLLSYGSLCVSEADPGSPPGHAGLRGVWGCLVAPGRGLRLHLPDPRLAGRCRGPQQHVASLCPVSAGWWLGHGCSWELGSRHGWRVSGLWRLLSRGSCPIEKAPRLLGNVCTPALASGWPWAWLCAGGSLMPSRCVWSWTGLGLAPRGRGCLSVFAVAGGGSLGLPRAGKPIAVPGAWRDGCWQLWRQYGGKAFVLCWAGRLRSESAAGTPGTRIASCSSLWATPGLSPAGRLGTDSGSPSTPPWGTGQLLATPWRPLCRCDPGPLGSRLAARGAPQPSSLRGSPQALALCQMLPAIPPPSRGSSAPHLSLRHVGIGR